MEETPPGTPKIRKLINSQGKLVTNRMKLQHVIADFYSSLVPGPHKMLEIFFDFNLSNKTNFYRSNKKNISCYATRLPRNLLFLPNSRLPVWRRG